jgi:hypothetical protein
MIAEAALCWTAIIVGIVWCWWLGLVIVGIAVAVGALACLYG